MKKIIEFVVLGTRLWTHSGHFRFLNNGCFSILAFFESQRLQVRTVTAFRLFLVRRDKLLWQKTKTMNLFDQIDDFLFYVGFLLSFGQQSKIPK